MSVTILFKLKLFFTIKKEKNKNKAKAPIKMENIL